MPRRAREDFASFVRARWTDLTDELVEEGFTRPQAQQVVVRGLADCETGWRRVVAEDNPEVVVREAVIHHAEQSRREDDVPEEPVTDPLAAIAAVRAERRRRIVRLSAISGVAAGVTAALVLAWPPGSSLPQPPRRVENNALPVAWWYGGELHLEKVVVEIDGVTRLGRAGEDVVVQAGDRTLTVDPEGTVSDFEALTPPFPIARVPMPHPELIPDTQVARSWTTTSAGNFIYAVQHRANEHAADESIRLSTSGPWLILQCSLQAHPGFAPCDTVTQLPADSAQPPIFEQR
jgi:hypothetical protein